MRVSKRATGTGTSPMSRMSTPVLTSPAITARLIILAAKDRSRLAVTTAPRENIVPYAAPNLAANSGTISMFASPETPERVKIPRRAWVLQMTLLLTVAPASTSLFGHSFTLGRMMAPSPMVQLSPITAPSKTTDPDLRLHCFPIRAPCTSVREPR